MVALEERLKAIELTESQKAMVKKEVRWQQLTDGGSALASLATGGVSDIFKPLLTINHDIERGIRETKQSILLEMYLNKCDDMNSAFDKLKVMIGDPYGNHLFNRLLWLLDNCPPEEIYIDMMSRVLTKLIDKKNYDRLFANYQLHLRMIERMSPQALYVLSHYEDLSAFTKEVSTTQLNSKTGQMELQGHWGDDLVKASDLDDLLLPVIEELIDSHYLVAVAGDKKSCFLPKLTESGQLLFDYLK